MSSIPARPFVSIEDYLGGEVESNVKHEYLAGHVYAMVGATNAHNLIASNVLGLLHTQLAGRGCRVFNSDTKVRLRREHGTYFYYPDVMVACSLNPLEETFQDAPVVIIEVLSDGTRRTDEGEKREAYLSIQTLEAYVLMEQTVKSAVVYTRGDSGFLRQEYGAGERFELPIENLTLELDRAYEGLAI